MEGFGGKFGEIFKGSKGEAKKEDIEINETEKAGIDFDQFKDKNDSEEKKKATLDSEVREGIEQVDKRVRKNIEGGNL